METNFYLQMENLINKINLEKINFKIIKSNIKKLTQLYKQLTKIWNNIEDNLIQYTILSNKEYEEIINIVNKNFLSENIQIKKIINNTKFIHCLSYSNINFYWLSDKKNRDLDDIHYKLGLNMFKISLTLNLYKFNNKDNISRYIIWIPIDKKRNFSFNKINTNSLKKSQDNFEAFVASGVTFGYKPKITIITRYEEVEKLLIHELIHNFNMDGSGFHNQMNEVLSKYENIKNNGNYHYEYSIYESYTEMLSTYIYLLFINITSTNNLLIKEFEKIEINKLQNKLMGQILLELLYSYNLICNLIKLNEYTSYDEFKKKIFFKGEICKYEYYYIKALMYNNFLLTFGDKLEDFINIYCDIINMINNLKNNDDLMMEQLYNIYIQHNNFKYQIH